MATCLSYDSVFGTFGEFDPVAMLVCAAAANRLKGKAKILSLETNWDISVISTDTVVSGLFTMFILSTGECLFRGSPGRSCVLSGQVLGSLGPCRAGQSIRCCLAGLSTVVMWVAKRLRFLCVVDDLDLGCCLGTEGGPGNALNSRLVTCVIGSWLTL